MKSVSSQRKQLYRLFNYSKETEAIHVRQITGDPSKMAAGDLTLVEANTLIKSLTTNWAFFDKNNSQHAHVLSLCHQLGWVQDANPKFVDLSRLNNWLKSFRSPVQKPLQSMEPKEVSKVIFALENMLGKKYK